MNRVHELGRLGRTALVAEWHRTHHRAPQITAQAATMLWSNERLIDQIITAEREAAARWAAQAAAIATRSQP